MAKRHHPPEKGAGTCLESSRRARPALRKLKVRRARQVGKEPEVAPWEGVRPDKVEQARRRLRNKRYPSKRVLQAVARILVRHLG